jgi:hypothetical protein
MPEASTATVTTVPATTLPAAAVRATNVTAAVATAVTTTTCERRPGDEKASGDCRNERKFSQDHLDSSC